MTSRPLLAAALFAGLAGLPAAARDAGLPAVARDAGLPAAAPDGSPAAARDLAVASRGGPLQQAQQDSYFTPFTAATGLTLDLSTWPGGLGVLRNRIEAGSNEWDVVLVTADELLAGCDDGLYEKLAWPALGGREHYLPFAATDCGAGAAVSSLVLAWDRDKLPATPGWADFWDVARYPGKRGLRRTARSNLEIALMADGVAPGDVYRTLRTEEGVDRAFRKLDQIKPYVVWWTPDARAAELLESGEVLLSSADSVSVELAAQAGKRLSLQWAGSLFTVQSWALMRGSSNAADALKLLAFAGDPARQAAFAAAVPYGPTAKGANEVLPAELQALSPTAPANLANALQLDDAFWRDNGDRLHQRFEAWLAAH